MFAVFVFLECDEQPKGTIIPIGGSSQMSYIDMTGVQVYHYPGGGPTFYPVDLSSGAINTVTDSTVIFVHSPSRIVNDTSYGKDSGVLTDKSYAKVYHVDGNHIDDVTPVSGMWITDESGPFSYLGSSHWHLTTMNVSTIVAGVYVIKIRLETEDGILEIPVFSLSR